MALGTLSCGRSYTVIKAQPTVRSETASAGESAAETECRRALSDGLSLYRSGDITLARKYFARAVVLQPDNWKAHFYLGRADAKTGRLDEAVRSYHSALRCELPDDRTDFRVQLALAEALEGQGQLSEARSRFSAALALSPESDIAQAGLQRLDRMAIEAATRF